MRATYRDVQECFWDGDLMGNEVSDLLKYANEGRLVKVVGEDGIQQLCFEDSIRIHKGVEYRNSLAEFGTEERDLLQERIFRMCCQETVRRTFIRDGGSVTEEDEKRRKEIEKSISLFTQRYGRSPKTETNWEYMWDMFGEELKYKHGSWVCP